MSTLGQLATSDGVRSKSAYRSKADVIENRPACPLSAITGREQVQQSAPLFDHLVGAGKQRRPAGVEFVINLKAARALGLSVPHTSSKQNSRALLIAVALTRTLGIRGWRSLTRSIRTRRRSDRSLSGETTWHSK
jgi:hypothetical protein